MTKPHPVLRVIVLTLGYAFLYIPILCLMAFSFNDSSMMTSWTGFSLKWYVELFNDQALLSAARLSLLIAALTATAAVRSEEHTSELQSLMRISYAVFCLQKKKQS